MSLAPLRLPPFRHLLFGYGVNQLGDWAGEIALAVAVFALTGDPLAVAATWLAHRCVLGLFAPLLVARLDHLPPGRVLPALYCVQAALFLAIAATLDSVGLLAILILVALDGLIAPTARALSRATLVAVTRPAGLHREGNAVVNVVFTANGVLAPAVGGVLVALMSPAAVLVLDAASFVLAAAALATCRLPHAAAASRERGGAVGSLTDALAHVRRHPLLGRLLGTDVALGIAMAAIIPVEVVFVTDTLGASDAAFGAVLTAWGLGMVVGGGLAARLSRGPLGAMLLTAAGCEAVSCLGMGAAPTVGVVLIWSVLGGVGNGMYGMAFVTAYQERTCDAFQARVNGLFESAATIAPGIGFALGGALAALASPRAVYLAAGLGGLVAVAWATAWLRDADWSTPAGASPVLAAAA